MVLFFCSMNVEFEVEISSTPVAVGEPVCAVSSIVIVMLSSSSIHVTSFRCVYDSRVYVSVCTCLCVGGGGEYVAIGYAYVYNNIVTQSLRLNAQCIYISPVLRTRPMIITRTPS